MNPNRLSARNPMLRLFIAAILLLQGLEPALAHNNSPAIPSATLPSEVPEQIRRFTGGGVELDEELLPGLRAIQELAQTPIDQLEEPKTEIELQQKLSLVAKVMMFGHGKALKRLTADLVQRLAVQGDARHYKIKFKASPIPNASIQASTAEMHINAGLIAYAKTVDEYASVIAHEMSHENKDLLKAVESQFDVESMLSSVSGYKDLEPDQREEIRADLGATERMLRAGLNPWAAYNFEKRFASFYRKSPDMRLTKSFYSMIDPRGMDFTEEHPAPEIRMAAIKAYIVKRSQQIDISQSTRSEQKWPISLNAFRWRVGIFTETLMNVWVQRAVYGYAGYMMLDVVSLCLFSAGITDTEAAREIAVMARKASESVAPAVTDAISAARENPVTVGVSDTVSGLASHAYQFSSELLGSLQFDFISTLAYCVSLAFAVNSSIFVRSVYTDSAGFSPKFRLKNYMQQIHKLWSGRENRLANQIAALKEYSNAFWELSHAYNSKFVNTLRYFNGLALRNVWLSTQFKLHLRQFLNETLKQNTLSDVETQSILKILNTYPPYVFENPSFQPDLLQLAQFLLGRPIAKGESFAKGTTESTLEYKLRLTLWIAAVRTLPKPEQIQLAIACSGQGLIDSAQRILGLAPKGYFDFVFSKANQDPSLAKSFAEISVGLADGERSFGRSSFLQRRLSDTWLAYEQLRLAFVSDGERVAKQSIIEQFPMHGKRRLNPRLYIDKLNPAQVNTVLAKHSGSIRKLMQFLDEEVISRNGNLSSLSKIIVDLIAEHPEWIQGKADVDLLLSRSELWPDAVGYAMRFTEFEQMFVPSIRLMQNKFPNVWRYEPAAVEKYHRLIVARQRELGIEPKTVRERVDFWFNLTHQGVSSLSDQLFAEVFEVATPADRERLEIAALEGGRVWEPEIKLKIARRKIFASERLKNIMAMEIGPDRQNELALLVKDLSQMLPERGQTFSGILEDISVHITSAPGESQYLQSQKVEYVRGEKQEDLSLRVFSDLLSKIIEWPANDQWAFILFLRGEVEPNQRIRDAFRTVGPQRIQRIFELLPTLARTVLIDSFLDSPKGLLRSMSADHGWGKTMIEHLMSGKTEQESQIGREVLTGFIYALQKVGNRPLQTYTLAYLLALPRSESESGGEILKSVLELFGATGIKIGQFLAVSGLLPEKESETLRHLQDKAKVPEREEIYQELRSILATEDLPMTVNHVLGSASLKYAVLAKEKKTGANVVLKVLRLSSTAHTNLEFQILEEMAAWLAKRDARKYGALNSIVNAARRAVERELVAKEEVQKSNVARKQIYAGVNDSQTVVQAPQEVLFRDRLIVADFAPGDSFFNLSLPQRMQAAEKILKVEGDNLFSTEALVAFDPDRHAGNYRIDATVPMRISPIDFGQLISGFTARDRDFVLELFSIAQILSQVSAFDWAQARIASFLSLNADQKSKLLKQLQVFFPDQTSNPVRHYFSLIAAIENSGIPMDIKYVDFIRAIIQLKAYEASIRPAAQRSWLTPSERLAAAVQAKINDLQPQIKLSLSEKVKLAFSSPKKVWGLWRAPKLHEKAKPAEAINSESKKGCESLLKTGS